MTYTLPDFIGNIGVAIILITYIGLQLGKVDGLGVKFSALNALGATLVIISLLFQFNLSAFIVEAFWALISLFGVWKQWGKKSPAASGQPPANTRD